MRVLYALCLPLLVASNPKFDDLSLERCSVWDTPCLTNLVQKSLAIMAAGGSEHSLAILDPMHLPSIEINQGGLKSDIEHIEVRGLSHSIIEKASLDKFSKQYRLRARIPNLSLNGTYRAAGFFHSRPMNGKGDIYLRASDLELDVLVEFDVREDDRGKKYNELKKYYYSFEVNDDLTVMLGNLYFGDQVQSAATHNYIQKNWKLISAEYGRVFLNPIVEKVYNAVKLVLHIFPMDTFVTDY